MATRITIGRSARASDSSPSGHSHRVIGVRGAQWRAQVTPWGDVHPDDDSAPLSWRIAADDRWYTPESETTTRQKWYAGTPVAETRVRVPTGDVTQRIWCTADLGGVTVMEFENESTLPVAIAVTRNDLLTVRAVAAQVPQGISLPETSIVLPLAKGSVTRVGLLHQSPVSGVFPDDVASYSAVMRGWEAACDVASQIRTPDGSLKARIVAVRSRLLLRSGSDNIIERARLGEIDELGDDAIAEIVTVVERRLKSERRSRTLLWDTQYVLATAAYECARRGDDVAADDIARAWLRLADRPVQQLPAEIPEGDDVVAWTECALAMPSPSGGECVLLPRGIPEPWLGANFECHGLVADPVRTVSYAVRWHGARPALLWEVGGAPGIVLRGGIGNESWHSVDSAGETLFAEVAGTSDRV